MEDSSKFIRSLDKLPVEILYRILDHLEIKDFLLSFRFVCTKFHTIINNYNRLFIEIHDRRWKVVISRLCQLIQLENITSLCLYNSYKFE